MRYGWWELDSHSYALNFEDTAFCHFWKGGRPNRVLPHLSRGRH